MAPHLAPLLLAPLAAGGTLRRAQAQSGVEKLQVAGAPTEDATNLYYAVKTGLAQRAGLDIEMIATSSGTAATTAVIAGTYDLARTSLNAVMAAFLRAIPIVIVAPDNLFSAKSPFSLLQIAPDSPYRTAADLNGKTIGSPALNDFNVLATRAWVDKNGGDWRSLKFVEIPNSALEGGDRWAPRRRRDSADGAARCFARRRHDQDARRRLERDRSDLPRRRVRRAARLGAGPCRRSAHLQPRLERSEYVRERSLRRDRAARRGADEDRHAERPEIVPHHFERRASIPRCSNR